MRSLLKLTFIVKNVAPLSDNQTFYEYLVSQHVSKDMIEIWRELSKIEGGYEKSVELGFIPEFDEFYRTTISFYPRLWLLKGRESQMSVDESKKRLRIFNMTIVEEASKDVTIYGVKYLTTCMTQDRECGNYLFEAFEMYNAFTQTQKLLKYIRMKYPDVSADLEKLIEEGKKQYNLLANEFEKRVVIKIIANLITENPEIDELLNLLRLLSTEERNDAAYHMLWFSRNLVMALYNNMLKK